MGFKAFALLAAAVVRVAREMVCVSGLVCHADRSFALVFWPKPECRVVHCRIYKYRPKA
jgi:hypothetical protein